MTDARARPVPAGFEPLSTSPFGELVGPLYLKPSTSAPVVGVRVLPQHANAGGRAHGGLLTTLADIALSRAVRARLPAGAALATADLQIAFLEGVLPGAWVEAHPTIDRAGRSVIHASCVVLADGRLAARALATFAVRPSGSA